MKTLKENFFGNLGIGHASKRQLIEDWLKKRNIKNYTINKDLTIDVRGEVYIRWFSEKQLPEYIQFGKVTDSFYLVDSDELESLKGCPKECENFYCGKNKKLKSLEGCPQKIEEDFKCGCCPELESLKGAPQKIHGWFNCNECNKLKSLEGAPKEVDGGF